MPGTFGMERHGTRGEGSEANHESTRINTNWLVEPRRHEGSDSQKITKQTKKRKKTRLSQAMKVVTLEDEEMYRLLDERHNPLAVNDEAEESLFQEEIRTSYRRLVDALSDFGEEGDYYGVSDFAVRPHLREDRRVVRRAPHVRQFTITILTEAFFRSDYLKALHAFLCTDAPSHRIWIDQDFDPNWIQTVILTSHTA